MNEKCDHIIGFCQGVDHLIFKSDSEETKVQYLSEKCSYFQYNSDVVFNYCPECGEKLNG